MINQNFVILGAIIAAAGSLSYLIDTLKGKVKPNWNSYLANDKSVELSKYWISALYHFDYACDFFSCSI